MGNKNKFKPYAFEKNATSNLSATIYASMLQSPAFLDLSSNAVKLYLYMKLQLYGQKDENRPPKYKSNKEYFYFNCKMYTEVYRIFKNGEQFTKYCHELIKNGFIEEVENGKHTKTKNVYKFSSKWKEWTKETDYRPPLMIKHDEEIAKKRREQRKKPL